MTTNEALLQEIDLSEFQSLYEAQTLYLQVGPLREHFAKIGRLCLVTSTTPKTLMRKYFNASAQALYLSLCRFLGVVEIDHVPGYLVYMMAQIL